MLRKLIVIFLILLASLVSFTLCYANEEVNKIGNKGLMLINQGKMDEGLELIRKATEMDPSDASWHMNYGSMLMIKGKSIFEISNKNDSEKILKDAERELLLAIKLFTESEGDKPLKAHCYFLLGDLYFYVFGDKNKAESLYKSSLEQYPKHPGALQAMEKFKTYVQEQLTYTSIMLDRFSKLADNDFVESNKFANQIPLEVNKYSKPTVIVGTNAKQDGDILLSANLEDGRKILFSFFGPKFWKQEIPLAVNVEKQNERSMHRERVTKEQAELFKELFRDAEQKALQKQGGFIITLENQP